MSVLPAPRIDNPGHELDVKSVSALIDVAAPPAAGVPAEHPAVSTTAAVTAPPPAPVRTEAIAPDMQQESPTLPLDLRQPRYYPPRMLFLEPSRMKREMRRL